MAFTVREGGFPGMMAKGAKGVKGEKPMKGGMKKGGKGKKAC